MEDARQMEMIRIGLAEIELPALPRPPVPPNAPATRQLCAWGASVYVYSCIAHVREIVSGLLILLDADNESAAFPLCRQLYEWTMHSAFVYQGFRKFAVEENWEASFGLFEQIDTGNSWIKNHGAKYAPGLPLDELPGQIRVKKFVAAYETFQKSFYGRDGDDVQDTYGLLSEHSHANGACFLAYRRIVKDAYVFGPADQTPIPHPLPYLLDWLLCTKEILSLAREKSVSAKLNTLFTEVLKIPLQQS